MSPVKLRGPIPLQHETRSTMQKSTFWRRIRDLRPLGDANTQRLLELVTNTAKDETALRNVLRIPIPDSVTIELSHRNLA